MNNVKKVAIVSCYFQHNFGSQLQAYATQMFFDNMNVQNETIRIDGLRKEINAAKYRYFISRIWDINTVKDKFSTVKKVLALKIKEERFKCDMETRTWMFKDFSDKMFHLSRIFGSKKELGTAAHDYSAFVVGSDQLWLPSNIEADYYTLNFVPENVPKIAFATSFGISKLPDKQARKAAQFLKRIDFLSVREQSGQDIVKELTGRDVPMVCDPTMLFTAGEWARITRKERFNREHYLFCYFLGNNPEQRKFVRKVKAETGYKIIQLQHCDEYIKSDTGFADYAPYNVGPAEFIQLIRDAEYVFTDSFHCSVFSMLHEKEFFTFRRYSSDSTVSTNSRLYSLLASVNLRDRMLKGNEEVSKCLSMKIDYASVTEKLDSMRLSAKQFLQEALLRSGITYDKY